MNIMLVLTATVDPQQMIFTNRVDPLVRLEDYRSTLQKWINNYGEYFKTILFIENSGYDLSSIKEISSKTNNVLISQTDENKKWFNRGKGFGEFVMLNRIIRDQYDLLKNHDYIVKMTGRIYVPNLINIVNLKELNEKRYYIISDRLINNYVDSRIVFFSISSYIKLFDRDINEININDQNGVYFEHFLADFIKTSVNNGKNCTTFREKPFFSGFSGTFNSKIDTPAYYVKYQLKNIAYKFRRLFFSSPLI